MRESTINLTLTIKTPAGVPESVSARTVADEAASRIEDLLRVLGTHAEVTGRVSSAFIVRTERAES